MSRGAHRHVVVPTGCACGDHSFAPSTCGFNVLVSPEDAHLLKLKWFARGVGYPGMSRTDVARGVVTVRRLSREIMNPPRDLEVDHINRDPSDNRRSNLRVCGHNENARNRRRNSRNSTGFKGVRRDGEKYRADITCNYARHFLGFYDTPEEASSAYKAAAQRFHGDFARFE